MAGTSFFIPGGLVVSDRLQPHSGGSPLLWQHLFWFFGHPEVYIAILPGFGIVSHILPAFARKPLLGPRVLIACLIAIGFLSYTVWGHHMFLSGMNPLSATLFSVPTLIITIPATIVTLLWIGTLYGSRLRFTTAVAVLSRIHLGVRERRDQRLLPGPAVDRYLPARHLLRRRALPLRDGRRGDVRHLRGDLLLVSEDVRPDDERDAGQGALLRSRFIGVYCIFMPMHYLGLAGNVRRYSTFTDDYMKGSLPLHRFITMAALLHRRGAAHLLLQPDPEPAPRGQGSRQSLAGDLARVVHQLAAAVRQFRRPPAGGVPRPQRVRGRRTGRRLPHAGGARACPTTTLTWLPLDLSSARRARARTGVWIGIAAITMSFAAYTSALDRAPGGQRPTGGTSGCRRFST